MKKNKKWLAIVLAVIMALSSLSVAFTAFAATSKEEVEEAIKKASVSTYDASVVKLFNDYEDKASIDKTLTGKLIAMTLRYAGESNARKNTAGGDVYNSFDGLKTLEAAYQLIQLDADMKAAAEMNMYLSGATKMEVDGAEYYYPSSFNATGTSNYKDYDSPPAAGKLFPTASYASSEIAVAVVKQSVKAYNALSENAKLYMNTFNIGETRPSINDGNNAKVPMNLLNNYLDIAKKVDNVKDTDLISNIKENFKLPESMLSAIDMFSEIAINTDKYNAGKMSKEEFVNYIDSLGKFDAAAISIRDNAPAIFVYKGALLTAKDMMKDVDVVIAESRYNIFIQKVKDIKEADAGTDAFNAQVEDIFVSYMQLTDDYKDTFKKDDKALVDKYYSVTGAYTGNKTAPNLHQSFEKEIYSGNALVGNTVDSAISALDSLLPQLLSGLTGGQDLETYVKSQFTNYNVTYFMTEIYKLLSTLNVGISLNIAFSEATQSMDNKTVANAINAWVAANSSHKCAVGDFESSNKAEVDVHFSEAAGLDSFGMGDGQHLEILMAGKTTVESKVPSWKDFGDAIASNPAFYDWGIQEGNFESFIDALLQGLRPVILTVSFAFPFSNNDKLVNGEYVTEYSLYEKIIIPLLEALGAKDVMSSAEFTAQASKYSNETGHPDAMLKPVLMQLYDKVLVPLMKDPVNYLLNNLPNLIYHIDDGCITSHIQAILDDLKLDMQISSFKDIVDLVYGMIKQPIPLTADQIYNLLVGLAKTGTPTVTPTAAAKAQNTITVVADIDNAVNYLVEALLDSFNIDLNFAVKGEFVKSEAPAYPHDGKMGKDVMNAMISGLDGLLDGLVNINDLINGLFTNVMAADAITAIYSALGGLNLDLSTLGLGSLAIPPSAVAAAMSEDIYKNIAEALTVDGDTWQNVILVTRNDDTIQDYVKMGFDDGDRDGFINCLTAALRPILKVAGVALVNGTLSDGSTNYGLYETLILPLFEDIGLTPAATSAEYTDNFNKLSKRSDPNGAYDYLLKTILAPVLDLVDNFAAAPAKTLFTVLPNLAYAIYYNTDIAFLGNLLDDMGGLTGILNGLLKGIATGEDENGNAVYGLANFELPEIPMNALASSGKVVEKKSKAALRKTYNAVEADTADAFVTTFYYLYDAINHKDNLKTISDLLAGIEGLDPSLAGMIDTILNDVFTRGKEEALCMLGTILAADVWECPDGDGNNGGKTPATGDYTVPAIAVLAVMFTAGAAIMVLRKKKVTE